MANYPPPPPGGQGGWGPPAGGYDPYGAERVLQGWAAERKYELIAQPDINFFLSWYPFQYLPRPTNIVRELRLNFDVASVFIVEAYDADPVKQALGGHRMLLCFLMSPKINYRAAVRSKSGGGNELDRGIRELGNLFGGGGPPPGSLLGDPVLERAVDVSVPTREEGNLALPQALRQLLVQNFRGAIETRPRGMAATFYDYTSFDPRTLDSVIHLFGTAYNAVIFGQ